MTVIMILLFILSLFSLLRVLIGRDVWDKILGFNLFTAKFILIIVMIALINDLSYLLDIALIYSMLGFVSIVFITRFIQRKGKI